ncbi:hypothetical protein P152DRAFT_462043 [Eremomyces bilateralis CBS 781.70]|uniref:Uncharacterized protein n=1 Tax=Eremomyces bilateralis CBS 781.70 TaxID=1392243 RepID=A0A6G1FSY9_9PEZI|nr:uncharacterized protein P152DRAFT_462043 [Eremomyces bilateralis CBS 781.70]KAF1808985.1 hypothetical protein P152DRAFT_462043 [Eremomyces bilateralis CBS 781.70]
MSQRNIKRPMFEVDQQQQQQQSQHSSQIQRQQRQASLRSVLGRGPGKRDIVQKLGTGEIQGGAYRLPKHPRSFFPLSCGGGGPC